MSASPCYALSDYVFANGFEIPAMLLLNEVGANITSSHDLIELRVIGAGSTVGIAVMENPASGGGGTELALLPNIQVAAADLIVVHLVPTGLEIDETVSKLDCVASSCYANAWDVIGGTVGIAYSDRVRGVRDAAGALTDAVAFARPGSSPATFPPAVQYIQSLGLWSPVDCSGAPCTYLSTPTVEQIAFDWTGLGTTPFAASASRHNATDTNQASDWQIVANSTFGSDNP